MPELLLEILTEEIPARMQTRAAQDLRRRFEEWCSVLRFQEVEVRCFVTPRRLALVASNVPLQVAGRVVDERGPRVGAPKNAIDGFARSRGLTPADLEQRDTGKGVYYFASVSTAGSSTEAVLGDLIESLLIDFPWPKSMRFPAARMRWVRPITSLLYVFNGVVVRPGPNHHLGDLPVGDTTRGHRFLAPTPFAVTDFADYRQRLAAAHVILDASARRDTIGRALHDRAAEARLAVKDDPGLLDEVTGLVEWPVVLMGAIDPGFMDLPPEVLTTSMRTHQKYFSCLDRDGRLAPRFLLVANNIADDGGKEIVAGNERVLRARLADARFFWDQDLKVTLSAFARRLDARLFYAGLGTVLDKTHRVSALALAMSQAIGDADPGRVVAAAELAKADLSSSMVGEFPELQGIMGSYYARHEGQPSEVAQAIAEHYSPLGPNDRCPTAPVSVAVALADKIDTLVGFFGIDEKPTGSRDPFALRRAALGVIRLILENEVRLPLTEAFAQAHGNYSGLAADRGRVAADLLEFFADRLKVHLREQGVRHDLIAAVFARGEDDLVRLTRRVAALAAFLGTEDGANLLAAYRRAANIVGIEEKRDGVTYGGATDASRFVNKEETMLAQRLDEAASQVAAALDEEGFAAAMMALAGLRSRIDDFFTEITVNVTDQELRANRLRLLARIRDTFDRVADFSRIEG